jgi:2-dehydro-3-deoxyphosphogluconate aldolase/(4S)-4-hydroxy-2-oxoglutarate aldolase
MTLLAKLNQQFIIPVIREKNADLLESICLALAEGGLTILEITLMSETAFSVIKKLSREPRLLIGAGTVITANDAEKAIDCGAQFLVSPGLNQDAFQAANKKNIPFFPGVLTPSEIMQATLLGAELIKIFPISSLNGIHYLNSLKGPFPNLKIMASGGVSYNDIEEYIKSGVHCAALGNQLMPSHIIKAKDWQSLIRTARLHGQGIETLKTV